MYLEIVNDTYTESYTTDPIDISSDTHRAERLDSGIQTSYSGGTGSLDGTIKLLGSIEKGGTGHYTVMTTYNITTASITDANYLKITAPVRYIKLVYTANNITSLNIKSQVLTGRI